MESDQSFVLVFFFVFLFFLLYSCVYERENEKEDGEEDGEEDDSTRKIPAVVCLGRVDISSGPALSSYLMICQYAPILRPYGRSFHHEIDINQLR